MTLALPRSLLQVEILGFVVMALIRQPIGRCIYAHEYGLGQHSLLGRLSFVFCTLTMGLSRTDRKAKMKVDRSGQVQGHPIFIESKGGKYWNLFSWVCMCARLPSLSLILFGCFFLGGRGGRLACNRPLRLCQCIRHTRMLGGLRIHSFFSSL